MYTSLTDETLIRLYLPDQPNQCFETLYARYVTKVYRRCLSLTHDSAKAEDFTHDIFLKVFNKLDAFQERARFSTWLYSIAYNYCLDQIRISRRITTIAMDESGEFDIPESQDALLHEETLDMVKRAMETLSNEETNLLRLKYEDGMSINEIADLYDLKPSAVKMRLKRSRDKIHQLYERQYNQ
ncbi:RNA polymerase sigma factor [Spirosoma sp. SC4-14]|uniref:RNA polymerase sigma factor n=1 Tax=Spirosoma sp. SC4-14 TaxID=3128900 RepID=UPI0030D0603D